jgi:hypothetical protein
MSGASSDPESAHPSEHLRLIVGLGNRSGDTVAEALVTTYVKI